MARRIYMTSEELARHPVPNKRTELVRGRLVIREPAKWQHGKVAARILIEIGVYLRGNPIGEVCAAETGFTLARAPDTVRAPDVAYIRADRVPTVEVIGFDEMAPDLAVEVLSAGDRAGMVRTKVAHWLRAGTRLVWLVDPRKRNAQVFRADGTSRTLTADEQLDGEDVLPGFSVPVRALVAD
ncbi:MAG: Uma2 family endonuclease [Gemmatimonadaceae bacterium]|nr:Uma2 family endonuclease [Gemmatimonadaceae bacterium]